MEQDKNNRLDELFNQAKNEPSKVSFDEIKGQFIKSNVAIGKASFGSKLHQFSNLKIIVMISTLSIIVAGAFMYINNTSKEPIEEVSGVNVINVKELVEAKTGHAEVVSAHLEKVKLLPVNLKELYRVKKRMAFKLRELPKDSLKRALKSQVISKRNQEILDTAYRFPNLGYEEIKANNKQKYKMLRELARYNRMPAINNIDSRKYPQVYWHKLVKEGKSSSIDATGSFHIQKTEVTNMEYRTFLFDLLLQNRKEEFLVAKPDQTRWVKDYPKAFNKPMQENYFSHPAYDNYPAVAMSRKGAEMYCKWLTEERNKLNPEKYGHLVSDVRLPTAKEWEQAARGNDKSPYPWGGPYLRNSEGNFLANFRPTKEDYAVDGAFFTVKVESYNPNDYGLYCMSGNVAEMVYYQNENNLPGTRGGSWTSVGQELQIVEGKDRFKGLTNPSVNVGFRPVLTYLGRSRKTQYAEDITVIPPGTKKIDSKLFFDEAEVSNAAWKEYLYWLDKKNGKSSNEYLKALPDTTVWKSKQGYNEPFVNYYLSHPAYGLYPVVGVSYEQAVAFCKWRTDRVEEYFEVLKQKNKKIIYPQDFEYRLPTKEEWERVARVGNSLKTIKKLEGTKYSGQKTSNLKREQDNSEAGELNDNIDITAPVTSYWPNKLGLYNLIGNVAEMTSEKGIAKGGAWIHQEKEVKVEKDFNYRGAEKWLGFRCVFEVKYTPMK